MHARGEESGKAPGRGGRRRRTTAFQAIEHTRALLPSQARSLLPAPSSTALSLNARAAREAPLHGYLTLTAPQTSKKPAQPPAVALPSPRTTGPAPRLTSAAGRPRWTVPLRQARWGEPSEENVPQARPENSNSGPQSKHAQCGLGVPGTRFWLVKPFSCPTGERVRWSHRCLHWNPLEVRGRCPTPCASKVPFNPLRFEPCVARGLYVVPHAIS